MIPRQFTVIGGAHIDRRGRIFGATAPAASNPGQWNEEAGGGGFNAARNLARLGHAVSMVSVRGGDFAGEMVEQAASEAGVSYHPATFLDRATPTYTAILEADGNLVIALADMALYDFFLPRRLQVRAERERIAASDILVCDANLPHETLAALLKTTAKAEIPLAAIAISPAKVIRFNGLLDMVGLLFMNEAEARALSGEAPENPAHWPAIMRKAGLCGGAITRGMQEAIAWNAHEAAALAPPAIETIGDVTGAGDAFAAGFLNAYSQGLPLAEMIRYATGSARLAVLSPLAAAPDLSLEALQAAMTLVPQPRILP